MIIDKIITTVFGNKFNGMLLTLLESISENWPGVEVLVYYQDIDEKYLEALSQTYSNTVFTKTKFNFHTDRIQRISSKTLMWQYAVQNELDGKTILLLDVDTLIVKPVIDILPDNFDLLITTKKTEKFPINSGVLLAKISDPIKLFFKNWLAETLVILQSPSLLNEANTNPEYGGADQMSLNQLVGYTREKTDYNLQQNDCTLLVKAIPCSMFNETNSRPLTADTYIVHYKSGWQRVLIEGKAFSKYRNWKDSEEMLLAYIKNYQAGVKNLQKNLKGKFDFSILNIKIPSYILQNSTITKNLSYELLCLRSKSLEYYTILTSAVPRKFKQTFIKTRSGKPA